MSTALNRNILRVLAVAGVALLSGCTGGDSDLKEWVAQEKAMKGAPIPPLPVLKTFETFEYKDQNSRDPFAPSLEEQQALASSANGPVPDKHPKERLEDYPLDALKMVGTVGAGSGIEGLIKDPEGTVSRVHRGNYLGQNSGKISAINEDHIELVELIPNGTGGWMERQATVALPEK